MFARLFDASLSQTKQNLVFYQIASTQNTPYTIVVTV